MFAGRANLVVSGGAGSGKTTLLGILSSFIPDEERLITIEDAAELRLNRSHVVALEARPPNVEGRGQVTVRDLVRNALRMRPDRIIVGEVRGGEALDMLQAMNTGHDGSLSTAHANSCRHLLWRLETMAMMSDVDLPAAHIRNQVASAIDVVVQLARLRDGRRVVWEIAAVEGTHRGEPVVAPLFRYRGRDGDGGGFEATGRSRRSPMCSRIEARTSGTGCSRKGQIIDRVGVGTPGARRSLRRARVRIRAFRPVGHALGIDRRERFVRSPDRLVLVAASLLIAGIVVGPLIGGGVVACLA